MQIARIIGRATSTVKHPSLGGWRLLIAQPLGAKGQFDGPPQIAIDSLGAGMGAEVMISSDGAYVRQIVGSNQTPIRWVVIGLVDEGMKS
jgi:ethanolamine utilization protein EutN